LENAMIHSRAAPSGHRRRCPDRRHLNGARVGDSCYYRSVLIGKFEGVPDAELRASRLPSGWTPLEMLKHLVFMEQRWLRWGFRAEQLSDPTG
jgi:hypothetical protein